MLPQQKPAAESLAFVRVVSFSETLIKQPHWNNSRVETWWIVNFVSAISWNSDEYNTIRLSMTHSWCISCNWCCSASWNDCLSRSIHKTFFFPWTSQAFHHMLGVRQSISHKVKEWRCSSSRKRVFPVAALDAEASWITWWRCRLTLTLDFPHSEMQPTFSVHVFHFVLLYRAEWQHFSHWSFIRH